MDLKRELKETVQYIIIGLVLAYGINVGLGHALDTDKPVMAVVSSSMEPTFYKGDLVVVKGIEPEKIAVGDIIVYHNSFRGVPVVHRVVEIKKINSELYFYTRGDNSATNQLSDQESGIAPPIRKEFVKGRVVLVVPKLGWFRVALSDLF